MNGFGQRCVARNAAGTDNRIMKSVRAFALLLIAVCVAAPFLSALEKQPATMYHQRRVALAGKLNGGVAVLFAAEEPLLDFMPYRQNSDFY
jgi:Xaa-Pro aminopeptidase